MSYRANLDPNDVSCQRQAFLKYSCAVVSKGISVLIIVTYLHVRVFKFEVSGIWDQSSN